MEKSKDQIINEILQMGFFMSQRQVDCWLGLKFTVSQLKTLVYIEFHSGVCIRDLSRVLETTQPYATNLVDSLVKAGLVIRKENSEDRRILSLKTTSKGKKLIADLRDSFTSKMSEYLNQLNLEQLQALAGAFQPLIQIMQSKQDCIIETEDKEGGIALKRSAGHAKKESFKK
jgi:DNA-binding MarR family transcriptional regulator